MCLLGENASHWDIPEWVGSSEKRLQWLHRTEDPLKMGALGGGSCTSGVERRKMFYSQDQIPEVKAHGGSWEG